MKTLSFALLLLSLNAFAEVTYFGARSTEAMLKFEGAIEVETAQTLTLEKLNGSTPKAVEIQGIVDYQLEFLIGHFQSGTFLASYRYPGVLADKHKVKFIGVEPRVGNHQIIRYRFEGKSVFHTKAFDRGTVVSVPLRLPANPYTLYKKGMSGRKNKCTDEHYDSEGDFFYFWDPDKAGCPLKGNKTDVLRIEGKLEKLTNTTSTYPEYDRLYNNDSLNISVFLGYIDDEPKVSRTKDDAYATYKDVTAALKNEGYEVVEQKNFKTLNYYSRLEKTFRNQLGVVQKVAVNVLLSDSSTGITDKTFVDYFANALKTSQIVAYDGHSGLGGNLDYERFRIGRLPNFYQIFFFNGCSSYPYFNSMYFDQKPAGKKNLEIITAGLPTLTSTSTTNMLSFLSAFVTGRVHSYQTILRALEKSNGEEETYLMGVNGDEDNRFKP